VRSRTASARIVGPTARGAAVTIENAANDASGPCWNTTIGAVGEEGAPTSNVPNVPNVASVPVHGSPGITCWIPATYAL
jgi:hypothetical protein